MTMNADEVIAMFKTRMAPVELPEYDFKGQVREFTMEEREAFFLDVRASKTEDDGDTSDSDLRLQYSLIAACLCDKAGVLLLKADEVARLPVGAMKALSTAAAAINGMGDEGVEDAAGN